MEKIIENQKLNQWIERFKRSGIQVNEPHESDAELIHVGESKILAVTTDTVCEEIEYDLYSEPYTIGWISVMSNFSDLAAVGADAVGLLLSVNWKKGCSREYKAQISKGMNDALEILETFLIGGDTNESSVLSLTGCAIGMIENHHYITRKGIKPGDFIYLSYPAGAGNLLVAEKKLTTGSTFEKHYRPVARMKEGRIVRKFASACIDTSDGVYGALDQLVRLNKVGMRLETEWKDMVLPACRGFSNISANAFLAGYHGEYELVFAVPESKNDAFIKGASIIGWKPVFLGRATSDVQIEYRGRCIDTGYFRNLLEEVDYNIEKYIYMLIEKCKKYI